MLIDGDARSRRILMERGHSVVPFAQMRTDPTLDRSSIFSQTGSQYAVGLYYWPFLERNMLTKDTTGDSYSAASAGWDFRNH